MGPKWRWIWQEMKSIRLAFCFVSEDWLLCFLLIGQLKVHFHFSKPLQKVISGGKLFGPALPAARNSLCTPVKSGRGKQSVILAPVLLRDPLIVAFCCWLFDPFLLTPWTSCYQSERTGAKKRQVTVFPGFVYILSVFHYLKPHLGAKTGHLQTLHPTTVSQGSLCFSKYACCWLSGSS